MERIKLMPSLMGVLLKWKHARRYLHLFTMTMFNSCAFSRTRCGVPNVMFDDLSGRIHSKLTVMCAKSLHSVSPVAAVRNLTLELSSSPALESLLSSHGQPPKNTLVVS